MTASPINAAIVTFETRALSGDVAPGTAQIFRTFDSPLIDASGQIAFQAITTIGTRGLWSDTSGALSLVALNGMSAPGTTGVYNFLDTLNLSSSGKIAFGNALLTDTGGVTYLNNGGIWSDASGSLSLMVREGDVAPGTAGAVFEGLSDTPRFNDAGQIVFSSALHIGTGDTTSANDQGIWSGAPGTYSLVVRDGDAAPGTAGGVYGVEEVGNGTFGVGGFNGSGRVVLYARLLVGTGDVTADNDEGLWTDASGSLSLVARKGSAAPGTTGGLYESFNGKSIINDAGQIAFNGYLAIGTGDVIDGNHAGIWSDRSGSLDLVVRAGDAAPGAAAGEVFRSFSVPALNGDGQIAFAGSLTGPGVTTDNDEGIWFERSDTLTLIAREGSAAAGTNGVFRSIGSSLLNSSDQIAFTGTLRGDGITLANDRGVWVADPSGELHLIIREGDLFDVNDDPLVEDLRTIAKVTLIGGNSGGENGSPTSFNDAGQIVFKLKFTNDSSEGIFVATLRLPGDLSGDWFVDDDDIAILAANWGQSVTAGDWSQGDPSGDGLVSIPDLRAVLSNWDSGVPPTSLAFIPEPASLAMLGLGGLALTYRRRSTKSFTNNTPTPTTGINNIPGIEPLEPRLLLSGSISSQFVVVDNSAALAGYNTFDLQATMANDWVAGEILLTLTQGTIYQDPNGNNTTPNPAQFGAFPTLEFDTYVGGDVDSPAIIGEAVDLGGDALQFDASELDVTWYNTDTGDTGTFNLARFTLSDDAEGTWSILLTDADDATLSDSGIITAGTFVAAAADGDFTGDGKADIFWRNTRNGRNAVWEFDGTSFQNETAIKRLRNTDWKLVGTGDFTCDGKNDLLWRNTRDGRNSVWEMDGTTFSGANAIQAQSNLNWQIAGIGDFTGDGRQDIFWRNTRNGRNIIWEMDGLTFQNATAIRSLKNLDWQASGVADFTGDGKDDILWHNISYGRNTVWEMDGAAFQRSISISKIKGAGWQVGGVADYTGDGLVDIFWRHTGSGVNMLWRMDGITRLGTSDLLNQPNQDWQPAVPVLGLWED